jgi:hypothetical protein
VEDLQLARSYGLGNDAAKAEFKTADEFRRYARFHDRMSLQNGERIQRELEAREQRNRQQPAPEQGQTQLLSQLMREECYDEAIVKRQEAEERRTAELEQRARAQDEYIRQIAVRQQEQQHAAFDEALEVLDMPETFGADFESARKNDVHYNARARLYGDLHRINLDRESHGLAPLPLTAATLRRVMGHSFPDTQKIKAEVKEKAKAEAKADLKKSLQRRSAMRTGSSGSRTPVKPGEKPKQNTLTAERWKRVRAGQSPIDVDEA